MSLKTYATALIILLASSLPACSSPGQSLLIYQLPFVQDTSVRIWQDHLTHSPPGELDMAGVGNPPHSVAAARAGTISLIEDGNDENCPDGGCDNNYVWIEHIGNEWTKYSHLETGSVTGAGWEPGDQISMNQFIGFEGNIGVASGSNDGRHLHFEVRVVEDTDSPSPDGFGDLAGETRVPRFCGVAGQTVVKSEEYTVTACPQ